MGKRRGIAMRIRRTHPAEQHLEGAVCACGERFQYVADVAGRVFYYWCLQCDVAHWVGK